MPINKYALMRYRIIDRCLTNSARPFPSREDLRAACEEQLYGLGSGIISLSTIDKDIASMKNEGDLGYYAPIAYDRARKGYYYADENYTISEMSLERMSSAPSDLPLPFWINFEMCLFSIPMVMPSIKLSAD